MSSVATTSPPITARAHAPGPSFDNYAMALQAAVDGVGVAIGLRPYVEDDLASGRLVAPFKLAVPQGAGLVSRLPPVSAGRCGTGRVSRLADGECRARPRLRSF